MRDHAELAPAFEVLLAVGGQCGLPILVLTSLRSRRVNPSSTFVNLCLTLIIHSLVFCLLIYTGQNDGRQVNRALCVSQAAMIMGILPTVCTAALMVVLQTWATFQDPGSAIFVAFERPHVRFMLLAAPYITFLGYMLGSILVATSRPDSALAMNGLFCTFHLEAMHFLTPLSCLVLLTVMTALEVVIVVRWYRQWYSLKKAFPLATKKAEVLTCLRVGLFSVYTWLSLAATVTFQRDGTPDVSYFAVAGLPLVAFIVFATQKDVLEAWKIRRPAPSETSLAAPHQPQVTSVVSSTSGESGSFDRENLAASPYEARTND